VQEQIRAQKKAKNQPEIVIKTQSKEIRKIAGTVPEMNSR